MLTMGTSGSVMALHQSLTNANVLGGSMSAYFVITALTTVRPVSAWMRRLDAGALIVALALVVVEVGLGVEALASPGGSIQGVPFFTLFFLAAITTMAAAGDIRRCDRELYAAVPGLHATCGECASRCSSRPDRFFPSARASLGSCRSHSRPLRCAPCRSR